MESGAHQIVNKYRAKLIPTLFYSAVTYMLYHDHIKRLEAIQQRHITRNIKIKLSDYVPKLEVIRKAELDSVEAVLATMQRRWTGHAM